MAYPARLKDSVAEIPELVRRSYGLDLAVESVRDGYMSVVVFLSGDSGRYTLKVIPKGEMDPDALRYSLAVSERLGGLGLPVARSVGRNPVEAGDHLYVLRNFLPGEAFSVGNTRQLSAAGVLLADFHRVGTDLADLPQVNFPPLLEVVGRELTDRWRRLDRLETVQGIVRDFRGYMQRLLDRGEIARLSAESRGFIHGDYRGQNVLFSGARVSGLVDLDGVRPGHRLFDLSYSLVFYQAVLRDSPPCVNDMQPLLEAYHRAAPLTDAELASLASFLQLSLLRGLTLWMAISYLDEQNARARRWISGYLPMLRNLDGWVGELIHRTCP